MSGLGSDVDLTKPDEVKEYLENLGTEYRFGCYGEKNPKGDNNNKIFRQLTTALPWRACDTRAFRGKLIHCLFQLANCSGTTWSPSRET